MNSHKNQTTYLAVLLVVGLVALAGSPAAAQSEMTSKIRLECSTTPPTDCPTTAGQVDFAVVEGNLGINKVGGGTKVGIGTTSPTTSLHAAGSAGTTKILVEETSSTTQVRELFQLINNGGPFFVFTDTALGKSWAFSSLAFGDFSISAQQNQGVELRLTPTGNMTILGALTENSDVNNKQDLVPVSTESILDKVANLEILEWSYKHTPDVRHVGPTAQGFHAAFGLNDTELGIAGVDAQGVALASIQALNSKLVAQSEEMNRLAQDNEELRSQLAELRQLIEANRN